MGRAGPLFSTEILLQPFGLADARDNGRAYCKVFFSECLGRHAPFSSINSCLGIEEEHLTPLQPNQLDYELDLVIDFK